MKKKITKFGYGGSILTMICCLAKPSLIAFFSSLGLAFAIDEEVLVPLLFIFLTIVFVALLNSYFIHRSSVPLSFALGGSIAVVVFHFIFPYPLLAYTGVLFVFLSSILDLYDSEGCEAKCGFR